MAQTVYFPCKKKTEQECACYFFFFFFHFVPALDFCMKSTTKVDDGEKSSKNVYMLSSKRHSNKQDRRLHFCSVAFLCSIYRNSVYDMARFPRSQSISSLLRVDSIVFSRWRDKKKIGMDGSCYRFVGDRTRVLQFVHSSDGRTDGPTKEVSFYFFSFLFFNYFLIIF